MKDGFAELDTKAFQKLFGKTSQDEPKLRLVWFRRDLRLQDHTALAHARVGSDCVQALFIFDQNILERLANKQDARVSFIHQRLCQLKEELQKQGSDLWVFQGRPEKIFAKLFELFKVQAVYTNEDYESYAINRDQAIKALCTDQKVEFNSFKDQVIFAKQDLLKDDKKPYTVYTPYRRKWMQLLTSSCYRQIQKPFFKAVLAKPQPILSLADLGFQQSSIVIPKAQKPEQEFLNKYPAERDFPALDSTSRLGVHLRFGTVSIRQCVSAAMKGKDTWLSELIWREFFMQILYHFPDSETQCFKKQYEALAWRNSPQELERFKSGMTGYPLIDAGIRELLSTGHMHNRVRMLVASFLTKNLLIYWKEGERFFAEHLLDFELASNVGNWQWAAGCGCDAAPFFRIFNPELQTQKFDPDLNYVKQWVPELGSSKYPAAMVSFAETRKRALAAFARLKEK